MEEASYPPNAEPIVDPGVDVPAVNRKISDIVFHWPAPRAWWAGFAFFFAGAMLFLVAVLWLFIRCVGIWGVNIPVAWAFAIINFVWWIGIGHAGTFISAFLLLLHQEWRTSINRLTEAMTLFAVACAGMMPFLHLGRPIYFYWMFPYPDTMGLWPQFRSPLTWDVFAVSTYFTVSLIFWYVGLLPDLATMRDRAPRLWARRAYGILALGWRGASRHWAHYRRVYVILAGLATPLVISVHSIVGMDFAVAIVPGWHETIFPPYFVGGAIYSGFAMVVTIVVPFRALCPDVKPFITRRHLELMAIIMLVTGWVVVYGYFTEYFTGWWSGDLYDQYINANRAMGSYAPWFWMMVAFNVVLPQFFWFRRFRRNVPFLFAASLLVNVGMWVERFVIIVVSLHRDFMPSMWHHYAPTFWDFATFFGSVGLFFSLVFLFVRLLPAIAMAEHRELVAVRREEAKA